MNPGALTALILVALGPLVLMAPFIHSIREKKERKSFVGVFAIIASVAWALAMLSGAMASQASSDWGVFGGMAMMLGFTSYVLAGLVFITNFLQDSPAPAKKEPIQLPETTRGK